MTPYFQLEKRGVPPPAIEELSDEDVERELTNLIWNLADLQIFIGDIEHLDDRTAYAALLDFCDEPNMFFPGNKRAACHWSPIDTGSDEDDEIYLRYYASDFIRASRLTDFGGPVPEKLPKPFPRPWIPVWNPHIDAGEQEE